MSDASPGGERRHFTRIHIDCDAVLHCQKDSIPTHLLDVSLKGALLERPTGYEGGCEAATLELLLQGNEVVITMQGKVVHSEETQLGFYCEHIDLDSIAHLRRIVELNLGDEALLERELGELYHE